eukprot:1187057-Prorocentrum_minimum.AAC.2
MMKLAGGISARITAQRYDESVHQRFQPGDPSKKAFTYFVLTGGRFIYATAIRLIVLKFLMSMSVSISLTLTYATAASLK